VRASSVPYFFAHYMEWYNVPGPVSASMIKHAIMRVLRGDMNTLTCASLLLDILYVITFIWTLGKIKGGTSKIQFPRNPGCRLAWVGWGRGWGVGWYKTQILGGEIPPHLPPMAMRICVIIQ
jgi:hypothetical protein